jgi:hypothetical protein
MEAMETKYRGIPVLGTKWYVYGALTCEGDNYYINDVLVISESLQELKATSKSGLEIYA